MWQKWFIGLFLFGFSGLFMVMGGTAANWKSDPIAGRADLPRLARPLNVDGDLSEWTGILPYPLQTATDIAYCAPTHTWKGESDASGRFYFAWTDRGLAVAAQIADDEVINTNEPKDYFLQDCLEIFVDCRAAGAWLKAPYSAGCFQLVLRPPVAGDNAARCFSPQLSEGLLSKIRCAGKKTATGYDLEMFFPWELCSGFQTVPGARVGFQMVLIDYDRYDKEALQPLRLSWAALGQLNNSPQKFIAGTLCDAIPAPAALDPAVKLDVPACCLDTNAAIRLAISPELAAKLGNRITLNISDWNRHPVLEKTLDRAAAKPAGALLALPEQVWNYRDLPDGVYTVTVSFADPNGGRFGTATRQTVVIRGIDRLQSDVLSRLAAANLAELSQQQPFRAEAWFGVVSAAEWLKRGIEQKQPDYILNAREEIQARLAALNNEPIPEPDSMFGLLNLTRHPEAQTVVEFSRYNENTPPRRAMISMYWGSFPLVGAQVAEYESAAAAQKAYRKYQPAGLRFPLEEVDIEGTPCSLTNANGHVVVAQEDCNPEREVRRISPKGLQSATLITFDQLDKLNVKALAFFAGCPEKPRTFLTDWARKNQLPIIELDRINAYDSVALAGRPDTGPLGRQVAKLLTRRLLVHSAPGCLFFAHGRYFIRINTLSRDIACRFAALIIRNQPVTEAQNDEIRRAVVAALPVKTGKLELPPDRQLFCGDVHMHSIYSDGKPTPLGLLAEAFYCNMDFSVLTDHNAVDGAILTAAIAARNGFGHKIVVGEEVTTKYAHMNAYPLQQLISWTIPDRDVIKEAHRQGAVIQWNHPGEYSIWEDRLSHGIGDTGFDAWEHFPAKYDEWKKAGRLPVLTGSTDTHSGTFGDLQRTIILAPEFSGANLAEAIRSRTVVMIDPDNVNFFCGNNDLMIRLAADALADGGYLKNLKVRRLRDALRRLKVCPLLEASQPERLTHPEVMKISQGGQ